MGLSNSSKIGLSILLLVIILPITIIYVLFPFLLLLLIVIIMILTILPFIPESIEVYNGEIYLKGIIRKVRLGKFELIEVCKGSLGPKCEKMKLGFIPIGIRAPGLFWGYGTAKGGEPVIVYTCLDTEDEWYLIKYYSGNSIGYAYLRCKKIKEFLVRGEKL